jgi:SAM-dependent methyltransferase
LGDFRLIQTQTGWGKVLADFADWLAPKAGWSALDIGCGPGLFPALLEARGCHSFGVDLDMDMFRPNPLHSSFCRRSISTGNSQQFTVLSSQP